MGKIKFLTMYGLAILFFGNQIFAQSKPDIYARPALYLGGKLTDNKVMNQGAKYATPENSLEVSKSDSVYKKDNFYYFSGGYILFIKTPENTLSSFEFINQIDYGINSDGLFLFKPKATDKNIIGYAKGAWAIAHHQNIGLREGVNNITLTLDKGSKVNESNENNNIYKFTVTLKP